MVGVLVQQFRTAICVTLTYIGLSIGFHVWSLNVRWDEPDSYWWTNGLLALFTLQRFGTHAHARTYARTHAHTHARTRIRTHARTKTMQIS